MKMQYSRENFVRNMTLGLSLYLSTCDVAELRVGWSYNWF